LLKFITENIGSIIVAAVLIAILIPVVLKLIRDKKKGACSSCVGCAGCSNCAMNKGNETHSDVTENK